MNVGVSFDISFLCMGVFGFILLIGYIGFSYFVTHKGDFYHTRRWKAAIWVADIFGGILVIPLFFFSIRVIVNSLPVKSIVEVIGVTISGLFSILAFILPFVFMVCTGMHHSLKWWLTSDDYLDKIWKDPNKDQKSPIQEI